MPLPQFPDTDPADVLFHEEKVIGLSHRNWFTRSCGGSPFIKVTVTHDEVWIRPAFHSLVWLFTPDPRGGSDLDPYDLFHRIGQNQLIGFQEAGTRGKDRRRVYLRWVSIHGESRLFELALRNAPAFARAINLLMYGVDTAPAPVTTAAEG
jgi:hypothetical protein